jgi:hypothetical protein
MAALMTMEAAWDIVRASRLRFLGASSSHHQPSHLTSPPDHPETTRLSEDPLRSCDKAFDVPWQEGSATSGNSKIP